MIQQLQEWAIRVNSMFSADDSVVNFATGLLVVITWLSMRRFKYTPSSKFKWSKPLYYSACVMMLFAVGVNRFIGYPPTYPASSSLYLFSFLLVCGYILYAGSSHAHKRKNNGDKAISTTQND